MCIVDFKYVGRLYWDTLISVIAWKQWENFLSPLWDKEAARNLRCSALYAFYSSEERDQLLPLISASIGSESSIQPKIKTLDVGHAIESITQSKGTKFH